MYKVTLYDINTDTGPRTVFHFHHFSSVMSVGSTSSITPPLVREAEYCDERVCLVCLSVCLSVCPQASPELHV